MVTFREPRGAKTLARLRRGAAVYHDRHRLLVVVKNRAPAPKPWQWEIYRAGRNSAIERSKAFFETATEANRAGKLALRLLFSEYPE